jgi:branched-chain amino acid transport system substrate-binding protein
MNCKATRLYLLVACAAISGCRDTETSPAQRDARARSATGEIVIGVAWPWAARKDVLFGEGLDLAMEQINGAGGIRGRKLRLLRADDHESVNDGRVVAQQLAANPDIVAVIGHLQSYVTLPAAAIYDLAGVVMVAPIATAPELTTQGYSHIFRGTVNDRIVGRALADVAAQRGFHRIAICYIRDGYGRSVSNAFEERAVESGLTVVSRESYDPNAGNDERAYLAILNAWRDQRYDAILLAGENPSAANLVKALRQAGVQQPVLGGDAMSSTSLTQLAGASAEGVVVASVFHPDEPRREVHEFVSAFQQRFRRPPDAGAALGFDALHVLADAMHRAGTSAPSAIAQALRQPAPYAGVTGRFAFDSTGEPRDKRVVMTVVRGGQFQFVLPAEVAAASR